MKQKAWGAGVANRDLEMTGKSKFLRTANSSKKNTMTKKATNSFVKRMMDSEKQK